MLRGVCIRRKPRTIDDHLGDCEASGPGWIPGSLILLRVIR